MTKEVNEFSTSTTLLRQLADLRNEQAWSTFVARYEPMILRWCRGWRLQPDEAREMASRLMCKLVREMGRFQLDRSRGRFRGWLKTVLHREVMDYWRGLQRLPGQGPRDVHDQAALERLPDPGSIDALSEELGEQFDQDLLMALRVRVTVKDRVGAATWQAFWLTAAEGLSAREAASRLKLTITAVSQAKYRVGKMLRAEWDRCRNDSPVE